MTRLSVNINKLATLRNSRGGNNPDILDWAEKIEKFGAQGITVHPRPDERHIRYADVFALKNIVTTEFNIEGNPREEKFVELVLFNKPHQVTLVPDAQDQLTSNHGWDTIKEYDFLRKIIPVFQEAGIRVSIFLDADVDQVKAAKQCCPDRIELYTENYAKEFAKGNGAEAILPYQHAANQAAIEGLGLNAGHDLDLHNLKYFASNINGLLEVSIGHALVCDALMYGMENTVQMYRRQLT